MCKLNPPRPLKIYSNVFILLTSLSPTTTICKIIFPNESWASGLAPLSSNKLYTVSLAQQADQDNGNSPR